MSLNRNAMPDGGPTGEIWKIPGAVAEKVSSGIDLAATAIGGIATTIRELRQKEEQPLAVVIPIDRFRR